MNCLGTCVGLDLSLSIGSWSLEELCLEDRFSDVFECGLEDHVSCMSALPAECHL